MPVFTEDEKGISVEEDLVELVEKREPKGKGGGSAEPKKFPIAMTVLIALVVILGAAVAFVGARQMRLSTDVEDLKTAKARVTALENRLEGTNKENAKLKADVEQLKGELDSMKAQKAKAEAEKKKQQEQQKKKPPVKKPAPTPPKKPRPF